MSLDGSAIEDGTASHPERSTRGGSCTAQRSLRLRSCTCGFWGGGGRCLRLMLFDYFQMMDIRLDCFFLVNLKGHYTGDVLFFVPNSRNYVRSGPGAMLRPLIQAH